MNVVLILSIGAPSRGQENGAVLSLSNDSKNFLITHFPPKQHNRGIIYTSFSVIFEPPQKKKKKRNEKFDSRFIYWSRIIAIIYTFITFPRIFTTRVQKFLHCKVKCIIIQCLWKRNLCSNRFQKIL